MTSEVQYLSQSAQSSVWVFVEYSEQSIRSCTIEALEEGQRISESAGLKLCAIIFGNGNLNQFVETLGLYKVDTVFLINHPLLINYNTDAYTTLLARLIEEYHPYILLISATPNGQDLAPRLAARLNKCAVTGCTMVKLDSSQKPVFTKPTHEGKIYTTLTSKMTPPYIATLLPDAIGEGLPGSYQQPSIIEIRPELSEEMIRTKTIETIQGDPKTIDIREAESIVSGGLGAANKTAWEFIELFADDIHACVGGTRMAADMGYVPRERMIGQTGKSVKPRLYIAFGVSGTHYHLYGVETEHMISVNIDRNASILKISKLGIIGNLEDILPALHARLQAKGKV